MPTAGEYETMATGFESRADAMEALPLRFVAALTPAVMVGPLVQAVDQTFQVSARNLVAAAVVMRDAASLCRTRAEACREYTRQLERHWQLLRDPDVDPAFLIPPRKLEWMEYGW